MELVRLMCDHKAIYDDNFKWMQVEDVGFILSAESEFKSKLSPRLSRHFCNFHMLTATEADLLNIYRVRLCLQTNNAFVITDWIFTELLRSNGKNWSG